ncbi:MAG: hypothetical protein CL878_08710 [Dehalococcoidia bacterium]|nr:hypothetical protein [Dehalococcoidia bacterium]
MPHGRVTVVAAKEAQRTRRFPGTGGTDEPDVVVQINGDSTDPEQRRVATADESGSRRKRYSADRDVLVREH